MFGKMCRRGFIKECSIATGAVIGLDLAVNRARAARITYRWPGWPKSDDGFTEQQVGVLKKAINVLAARFDSADVRANTYAVATRSITDDDYDLAIGLPNRGDWNFACMRYQLAYYLQGEIPVIHLKPFQAKSDYWGNAPIGIVKTHDITKKTGKVTGEFVININRHWLAAPGSGSDPEAWAGLLAHEMMHNLGHMHGKDEYTVDLQINAFQWSVYWAGKYRRGLKCPPVL